MLQGNAFNVPVGFASSTPGTKHKEAVDEVDLAGKEHYMSSTSAAAFGL